MLEMKSVMLQLREQCFYGLNPDLQLFTQQTFFCLSKTNEIHVYIVKKNTSESKILKIH